MNKILIISVLLPFMFLLSLTTVAQEGGKKKGNKESEVSAKVVDSLGMPIAGAKITSMEGRYVVSTTADGAFKARSGSADYIYVEAPGFEPQAVHIPSIGQSQGVITMRTAPFMSGVADEVEMPFERFTKRQLVGAVSNIKMDKYKDTYNDRNFWSLLSAYGLGMFSARNARGMGSTVVVDGMVRDGNSSDVNYSDMINADEIEEISVLKDPASRLLYGSLADKSIIMIKTRRGEAYKRKMNFTYEASMGVPISYPNYLKAADYMMLYNEARANDGLDAKYTNSDIANTRAGIDPVKYPDVDYYRGNEFLRSVKPQQRVLAEFIGGSSVAQYYLNLGYLNSQSLLNQGPDQATNRFNVRGAVDVNLTDFLKVKLDGTAIFNAYKGPNYKNKNFWNLSTSERVNAYPLLVPIDRVRSADAAFIEEADNQHSILDGQYLVGGNRSFTQNIMGDLHLGGYDNSMDRLMSVNIGFDLDLKKLTQGLKVQTYFGSNNYNQYSTKQVNTYAVYTPSFPSGDSIGLEKVGDNNFVGSQVMNSIVFYRSLGWNNAITYKRLFEGVHSVDAALTSMLNTYKENGAVYTERNLNFGLRANYMYNNRYVAEYSGVYQGSSYLSPDNRWGYAQAMGAAWIMSEENFMKDVRFVNYLKLKASWGNTKTDKDPSFSGYHMYENTYTQGSAYNYGDGAGQNNLMVVKHGDPNISWVQRNEINAGVEASLLKNSLFVEANYFNSLRYDIIERLSATYPAYMGGDTTFLPGQNYGRTRDQGFEIGATYNHKIGEVNLTVGLNMVYNLPKMLRTNETNYGPGMDYRQKVGKSTRAVWGLVAEGLYTQEEIDRINNSADLTVVRPTFGAVHAGDIKYRDMNGDLKIDDEDLSVIGSSSSTSAYNLTINAAWRNLNLYAYFTAQNGASNTYTNAYYYVYGERKYPASVLGRWAYDPANGIDTRATATYPRLTANESPNNFRNSTYWLAKQRYFSMPALQLTYTFGKKISNALLMKKAMVFVRAQNLFMVGPAVDKMQLNIGSEPQMRWYYVGLKAEF